MCTPHFAGINGGVHSDIATLTLNNGEQLEYLHSRIIRLRQEINLYGETLSPTRLLFQCMKALSNIDKLEAFVAPKMTDIVKFLDNKGKLAIYTEVNIHGLYHYL